jgi:ATP-dependent exoDNAse (exonuclease V) alpha subunit
MSTIERARRHSTPNADGIVASLDGRSVTYGFVVLDMLLSANAATILKSQGWEYPAVIIQVLTENYPMLQRTLLYTGFTHGKRRIAQEKVVAIAVRNISCRRRWPKLSEWLRPHRPMSRHIGIAG